MNFSPLTILALVLGAAAYLFAIYSVATSLAGPSRVVFRYAAVVVTITLFFVGCHFHVDDHARAVDLTKVLIAIAAAGAVFYEQHRAGQRRPVAERWKRAVGIALGMAGIFVYFNGLKFGYPRYYHRWDQYHYYMGAKYFREMGYDGLYKCSVVAEDELGTVTNDDEGQGVKGTFDLSREVRHPDKKIRNLGGDNLLIPVTDLLAHPEECKARFSPERWEKYKQDVRFFRIASDKGYWEDMQKDHGFNPPPVWTILGRGLAELHGATTGYLQLLASLDLFYLAGMFVALWWAFGWRVFAVAAIFWGCQSSAPFYWTGGAFLRQDWLFFLVAAACLLRKRWFKLAGASLVYAALLRVFPGLAVVGWLVVAGATLVRTRTLAKHQWQMLLGGCLAAAVLIPVSLQVSGKDSYQQFYEHTLQVHDRTPLTNHMGLRVLVAHNVGSGPASGRMKYTKDAKLADPFEVWKTMRNDRYDRYKLVAYGVVALSLLFFVAVTRRVKSMWIALCLGQIFIILLSQLTCYYYSFMILAAPLTRAKKGIEAPLFGFAALSQFVWITFFWNDDKYTALTLISLLFCFGLLCAFARKGALAPLFGPRPAAVKAAGVIETRDTPEGDDE